MRRFGFIAFIVIITSCTDHTYTLNFMKIDFPDQIANDTMLNVAISQAERFYEGRNSNTYNCKTDKESYQLGELVVLSIENISEDTIYLSPPKSNTGISFSEVSVNSHLDKETIRKSLVSENPAIHGTTSYYFTPSFVTLHLSTLGKMAAEELNVEALGLSNVLIVFTKDPKEKFHDARVYCSPCRKAGNVGLQARYVVREHQLHPPSQLQDPRVRGPLSGSQCYERRTVELLL